MLKLNFLCTYMRGKNAICKCGCDDNLGFRAENVNSKIDHENQKSMSSKPKKIDGKSTYKKVKQRAKYAYLNLIDNHSWKE